MELRGAVEATQREGLPRISSKTINGTYMGLFATLLGCAAKREWTPSNPFKGLRVKDGEAARDKRNSFTAEQLSALFGSAPWRPGDDAPGGQPIRYWLPLFALWHGVRRGRLPSSAQPTSG